MRERNDGSRQLHEKPCEAQVFQHHKGQVLAHDDNGSLPAASDAGARNATQGRHAACPVRGPVRAGGRLTAEFFLVARVTWDLAEKTVVGESGVHREAGRVSAVRERRRWQRENDLAAPQPGFRVQQGRVRWPGPEVATPHLGPARAHGAPGVASQRTTSQLQAFKPLKPALPIWRVHASPSHPEQSITTAGRGAA